MGYTNTEIIEMTTNLSENIDKLSTIFSDTPDLIVRTFTYKQSGAPAEPSAFILGLQ